MLDCKTCERTFKREDHYAAHKCTGVDFVPRFEPIQNPVNILDEENDVLIEDVKVSERNNNVLLETPKTCKKVRFQKHQKNKQRKESHLLKLNMYLKRMKSLLMRKRTFASHLALSSTDNQKRELKIF